MNEKNQNEFVVTNVEDTPITQNRWTPDEWTTIVQYDKVECAAICSAAVAGVMTLAAIGGIIVGRPDITAIAGMFSISGGLFSGWNFIERGKWKPEYDRLHQHVPKNIQEEIISNAEDNANKDYRRTL